MKKCIVSTHYNRPVCSNWQTQSLKSCVGIDDWDVIFFVEPTMYEVVEVLSSSTLKNANVIINKKLLGKNGNKENALKTAEQDYDFILFLEDDVILGPDALLLMNWAIENIKPLDSEFLTVSPYSIFTREIYDINNKFKLRSYYAPDSSYSFGYWSGTARDGKNYHQIRPIVSRANNVGFLEGKKSDPSLEFLIKKLGHDVYDNNGLFCNPLGREWIKLDEDTVYSKPDISTYTTFLHKDWSKTLISSNDGRYFIER